jgi:hypothetical protein
MTSPSYNIWELSWDEPDWLEPICTRLLEVGVPPTAISKAFQVEVDAIKELQSTLDVQRYGTAEIAEAVNFLVWRAYQDALEILDSAPATQRQRFITTLLSRQSMILGKQSPEGMNRMRAELEGLIASVNIEQPLEPSIYATSEFNPVDGEVNDSEEGPTR